MDELIGKMINVPFKVVRNVADGYILETEMDGHSLNIILNIGRQPCAYFFANEETILDALAAEATATLPEGDREESD